MKKTKRILTGDRPTGQLHLGHYVGSLKNRVKLQDDYDCYFIIANWQVFTDHLTKYKEIKKNIFELMCDYLAIGLKPTNTFFIQSEIPELAELTMCFSFIVSLARLQRNPTIKDEIKTYGVGEVSYGLIGYPVSQAADILAFKADCVPVGQDQMPHVEQTREIARSFNHAFGKKVFKLPEGLVGEVPRLAGLDGNHKMSKSLDNIISFAHSEEETTKRVLTMVTDTKRVYKKDKGHPDECFAFTYWKIFAPECADEIRSECESASIGCRDCKAKFACKLNESLREIREKRHFYEDNPKKVSDILNEGTLRAKNVARETLMEVKDAMGIKF
ncbi:MAG: tryptophan--tRNA ligase [Bdellovibrionota bacterium]